MKFTPEILFKHEGLERRKKGGIDAFLYRNKVLSVTIQPHPPKANQRKVRHLPAH